MAELKQILEELARIAGPDRLKTDPGVTDHYALNDEHALAIVRSIVSNLNRRKTYPWDVAEPEEPLYDPIDLYGIIRQGQRFYSFYTFHGWIL